MFVFLYTDNKLLLYLRHTNTIIWPLTATIFIKFNSPQRKKIPTVSRLTPARVILSTTLMNQITNWTYFQHFLTKNVPFKLNELQWNSEMISVYIPKLEIDRSDHSFLN